MGLNRLILIIFCKEEGGAGCAFLPNYTDNILVNMSGAGFLKIGARVSSSEANKRIKRLNK